MFCYAHRASTAPAHRWRINRLINDTIYEPGSCNSVRVIKCVINLKMCLNLKRYISRDWGLLVSLHLDLLLPSVCLCWVFWVSLRCLCLQCFGFRYQVLFSGYVWAVKNKEHQCYRFWSERSRFRNTPAFCDSHSALTRNSNCPVNKTAWKG